MVVLSEAKTNTLAPLVRPSARSQKQAEIKRRVTKRDRAEIVRLYTSGMSSRAVADRVGVSKTTVLAALRAAGVPRRPRGVK